MIKNYKGHKPLRKEIGVLVVGPCIVVNNTQIEFSPLFLECLRVSNYPIIKPYNYDRRLFT